MLPCKPIILKLAFYQRPEIARHLLRLSTHDRRLRFGAYMSDVAIRRYVNGINFSRDTVFGILDDGWTLVGVAHLALDSKHGMAELGLSVDADRRGRGYGFALVMRGKLEAENLGYDTLFMHCLAENEILIHLAEKAGMSVVTRQGETDANRRLGDGSVRKVETEVVDDELDLIV